MLIGPDGKLVGKYRKVTKRVRGTPGDAKLERGRMLANVGDGRLLPTTDIAMRELHQRFMLAKPNCAATDRLPMCSVVLFGQTVQVN